METFAEPEVVPKQWVPRYAGMTMSKADFLKWESDDVFVYEFNNGTLEPTLSMKPEEIPLINRLTRHFLSTNAFREGGTLMPEADCWLTEKQMRRPDASFYSPEQLSALAMGEQPIPAFVIELISEYDENYKTETKLQEYFDAGVAVVWLILPPMRRVYVYTSPKKVSIATDDDLISAAPAVPDYQLKVSELFALV